MNCQNAQSMVLNFINNKLDKEETKAFIEHVRDCKDCWEELEIYYVMLVGLKQLDEGEELAADFRKKLQNEVESRYVEIEREAKRKHIAENHNNSCHGGDFNMDVCVSDFCNVAVMFYPLHCIIREKK